MDVDQREVLQNLIAQQNEVAAAIQDLTGRLETARTQYLKLTGAIEVLAQLNPSEEVEEEVVSETEVVSEEE